MIRVALPPVKESLDQKCFGWRPGLTQLVISTKRKQFTTA